MSDEPACDRKAAQQTDLKFRIVTLHGRRRAFSLEPEVWSVLQTMAKAAGRRLGHLIEDVLAPDDRRNGAAALRLAALRWQSKELARSRRDGAVLLRRVISAIPAPACALSLGQSIMSRNRPFRDLQARISEKPDDSEATWLTFGAPLPRIAAALDIETGRAVTVSFILRSREGSLVSGLMNISQMPGDGANEVYLCVVRSENGSG